MRSFVFPLVLAGLAGGLPAFSQGFGMVKMTTGLDRRRPPSVYLNKTVIAAQVESSDPRARQIARDLEDLLENELCRHDGRLKVNKQQPESLFQVTINNLDTRETWESRTGTEYKKVGTKTVYNKDGKAETKDVWDNVQVTKRYKVLDGSIALSFRGSDTRSGQMLDSGSLNETYKRDFLEGKDAPLESQVQQLLVRAAVRRILPSFVPTIERVEVQLAKGKLEDASKLGKAGLWTRMMEQLETMEPLKKPQDEAYRLYDLGVASEALAYQAEDLKTSKKMLEQAAIQYGKAIDLKPDEKYFREPQLRIQTAIAQMGKTEQQQGVYARAVNASTASQSGARSTTAGAANGGAQFGNQQVVDLVKSGLDENILVEMIQQAPAVQFDLSPQGTVTLLQSKVSNKVIAAMRAKAAK